MANRLITKNSSSAANVPTAGEMVEGELAINTADKKLYSKTASAVFQVFDGVYAGASHVHSAVDLTSGIIPLARFKTPPTTHTIQHAVANFNRLGAAENFDDLKLAGFYAIYAGSNTNAPTGENYDAMLVMQNSSDVGTQLLVPRTTDRPMAYRGWSSGGSFTAWLYSGWAATEADADLALYAKLASPTFTGTVGLPATNMGDSILDQPRIRDYGITHTAPTVSGNAVTVNCVNGNSFAIDMDPATADVTVTLSNPPASGTYGEVTLHIIMGTPAWGITWPGTVTWFAGGNEPLLTTVNNGVDTVHLYTIDAGANWYGTYATRDATAGGGTVTSVSGVGTVSGLTLTGTVTGAGDLTLGGAITGFSTTGHTHSAFDRASSVLSGGNVFSNVVVTDGITTAIATRALTAANVGAPSGSGTSTGTNTGNNAVNTLYSGLVTDSGEPATLRSGGTPTLNTGVTAAEMRSLIGAGTSSTTGTVTAVNNGNGMNFTNISTSGTVTMGTPGSLSGSTSNGVTTSSHTHLISSITAAKVLAGNLVTGVNQFFTATAGNFNYKIPFMNYTGSSSTNASMLHDSSGLTYNASTNYLTAGNITVTGTLDCNGNIVGDGATTITGIEQIVVDATADIRKTSHGCYLYHQSTAYDNDQNGGITFSTSAASGGVAGDIWFRYT